jgi:hypothetical protein
LGGVALVRNGKQQIIGAYAGDLQGNMWKFNLNDAANSKWGVDFGGDPLFSAGPTKPITAPPTIIDLADPNVWADGADTAPTVGYMVVFGTGKLFEANDVNTTDQQSVYGVWDDQLIGATGNSNAVSTGAARVAASKLASRNIGSTAKLVITDATKRGWYANYTQTGERQIYSLPLYDQKHNVMAMAVSPVGVATDACTSGTGGSSTPHPLDALWITTPPTPPDCLATGTCTIPPVPPLPCLGIGCQPDPGIPPPCVYSCSSPIQGASAFIQTDQKCANGATLVKEIFAEEITCKCESSTGGTSSDGSSTITTKSLDICGDPVNIVLPTNKVRKWRELFLR